MNFHFYKMQGCGNDFIFMDYVGEADPPRFSEREVQYICDRRFGIGADGLVILTKSNDATAKWIFFNSDGSEAEMCGNAARCAVLFLHHKYLKNEESSVISLETAIGIIKGKVLEHEHENIIEITLVPSQHFKAEYDEINVRVENEVYRTYYINTGVPHAVIEVPEIKKFPVNKVGKALVKHPAFGHGGANITFFEKDIGQKIFATTFERGVEAETLACGTGAAAAALIYCQLYLHHLPIEVNVPGGSLFVDTSPVSGVLLLRGPAQHVFDIEMTEVPPGFEQPKFFGVDSK